MNDQHLIDRTLAGETQAFADIVTRYQDRLYRVFFAITGHAEDAEDVTQEAFVQAFQKLATFHGKSQFYTWIYRIALNVWISRKRKKSVVTPAPSPTRPPEPIARGPLPGDAMEQAEQIGQVRAALACLAEEHRNILVLREMDGCDYETIAQLLDLPVGTVRSRLHRARLQLRDELARLIGNSSSDPA